MAQGKFKDLSGMTFGYLSVVTRMGHMGGKQNHVAWLCKCECGKPVRTTSNALTTGFTTNCGCKRETALSYMGITASIVDWARAIGIPYHTLVSRLSKGWSVERALREPPDTRKKRGSLVEELENEP